MKLFSIALIILYNIIFVYSVVKKKNIFGLGTIINIAINLNFLLFLMGWSRFITEDPQLGTYIIVNSTIIIFIIIMLLSKSPVNKLSKCKKIIPLKEIKLYNGKIDIYVLINVIYILLFLVENYIGSNSIIPNLVGIDIHTYSAPLISFVTRALFVMIFLNYICYENFKEKRYIVFLGIELLLFPVLRGARMNLFISLMQFGLFYSMYNLSYILRNKKKIVPVCLIVITMVFVGVFIGNKRIENQLEASGSNEDLSYGDFIKYSGPKDPIGILPWYYGYFPMSYANLDKTIENIDFKDVRTYGIYTARPVLVGLLQFDNLIKGYPDLDLINEVSEFYTPSATVGTGFVEFYIDFGYFAGISIALYGFLSLFIYNKIRKNIFYSSVYAVIAGAWFFMSFQNTLIEVITLYSIIYLALIYIVCVDKDKLKKIII